MQTKPQLSAIASLCWLLPSAAPEEPPTEVHASGLHGTMRFRSISSHASSLKHSAGRAGKLFPECIQEMNLFEKASLPTVLKRLKLKHAAAQIMVELYNLLRTRAEMKKFKEAACDLIGMAMPPVEPQPAATAAVTEAGSQEDSAATGPGLTGASVDAAGLDELAELRIQAQQQEAGPKARSCKNL